MIIDAMKSFFEECPLINGGNVGINFLGGEGGECAIECVPSPPVLKRYVDGGEVRQLSFVFASREFYDADILQSAASARFYEELCSWIEEKNRIGELPELGDGLRAEKIEVTSTGYGAKSEAGTARFQLQLRLIYRK